MTTETKAINAVVEAARASGDFSIGSLVWPGVSKLIEECGEVSQVCGKLLGSAGEAAHWDGTNLDERLADELADLQAAILFVQQHNCLPDRRERLCDKLALFNRWHEAGDPPPSALANLDQQQRKS